MKLEPILNNKKQRHHCIPQRFSLQTTRKLNLRLCIRNGCQFPFYNTQNSPISVLRVFSLLFLMYIGVRTGSGRTSRCTQSPVFYTTPRRYNTAFTKRASQISKGYIFYFLYIIIFYTRLNSACQTSISGGSLHCISCTVNGAGKCDPDGCPPKTIYQNNTNKCEGKSNE